ncbi:MAG: hypothetical protein Kow0069_06920 [Promethearchaeota archaeon]
MKVAFGKTKITPPEPEDAVGLTLAGYTPIVVSTGKLDDVWATAVLMEDEYFGVKRRLLWISLDLLKVALVWTDYVKEKLQEAHGIPPGCVMIHATHTHKAPDLTGEFQDPGGYASVIRGIMCGKGKQDKYLVWITRRLVAMVGEMLRGLEPCEVAWTKRPIERDDVVVNRRHPSWRSKPDVWVFAFRSPADGRLLGLVTQFACHGTTLANFTTKLSADWPGRFRARVEEVLGEDLGVVYFNGPSGDLNPVTTCGTDFEALEDPKMRPLIYGQRGTYASTKRVGRAVADQALAMLDSLRDVGRYYSKLEFKAYNKTFWVPMADFKYWSHTWPSNKVVYLFKKYLLLPVALSHEEPNFPGLAVKHRGREMNCYSTFQWVRMKFSKGDGPGSESRELSLLTAPGELFEAVGARLRKACPSGYDHTLIVQNAQDWIAYLFPREEYVGQGGYEPLASFSPVCGDYYEREVRELFDEVAAAANVSFW